MAGAGRDFEGHFRRLRGYPGSSHEEVRAKWLAVGAERAVVSHESALELHGLSDVIPNAVHLLVDRDDRGIRRFQGVTLHTTTKPIEPSEVVSRNGIRATDPVRSIFDAAGAGTAPERGGRVAELIRHAAEMDGRS